MINKEKIMRVDIYGTDGKRLLSTKAFSFPRDFFKIRGLELVSIRGKELPVFKKEDAASAVFEYVNGTRIKCRAMIDISTEFQLNFHVDEGEVLEERRSSYKVQTNEPAVLTFIERDDDVIEFEEDFPVTILNINLSGVLMKCDMELTPGDVVTLKMLDGNILLRTEILRRQMNMDNTELIGYGCKFLDVSPQQEERIARYIFDCQHAEIERSKITPSNRR